MALEAEITAIAARADEARQRSLMDRVRHIRDANIIRAYRALLTDANGDLKPEAVAVIADLGKIAQLGRVVPIGATDSELRDINGRRAVVLHLIERADLSGAKLRALEIKLRRNGS